MHKAITIMQFKLEGQLIAAHPEFGMEDAAFFTVSIRKRAR